MNRQREAGRWTTWTSLAVLTAALGIAVSAGWAGDRAPPKNDAPPDLRSVIYVLIETPKAGAAESIGDITLRMDAKKETLSPPYSKDLKELTDKLKEYVKQAKDPRSAPSVKIVGGGDLTVKAVLRVMNACRKAKLPAAIAVMETPDDLDLTNPDLGADPTLDLNYDPSRIEDVSIPGLVDPNAPIGIPNPPDAPNLPAPPGIGGTPGGAGIPPLVADAPDGLGLSSWFSSRRGDNRFKVVKDGGGNAASEAAVARGLKWLAHHQAPDGHWSLNHFERFAHDDDGKEEKCGCEGQAVREDDIAATGFGLLPFLGAGQTQKPNKETKQIDYSKTVKTGLEFLMKKQGADGNFGGGMYSHGIATIALCEAYGMTSDPALKISAQKAIRYIEDAQDPDGGGWRYSPRTPGDLSVTGWQLTALITAQKAGLELANKGDVLKKAEKFLDSVESTKKGEYSYLPDVPATPTMTAVGMLCREYLGVSPRNPGLLGGAENLKTTPPGKLNNLYFEYYAAQAMYNLGGDAWDYWNEGPDGKDSHTGIRDVLVAKRCTIVGKAGLPGATPPLSARLAHEDGSWDPDGAWGVEGGGRIMYTSLSLLTLEVYYRHVPLYKKDK
jgi:hypothetical protein